jgi:hypothetical protein
MAADITTQTSAMGSPPGARPGGRLVLQHTWKARAYKGFVGSSPVPATAALSRSLYRDRGGSIVNAVILLVWLAGPDVTAQAPKPTPPPPPPAYRAPPSTVVHNGHNGCCESDCGRRHRLLDCLRGLFRRCDDDCHRECRYFHHRHHADRCDDGCGHRLFGWLNRWRHRCDDDCDNGFCHRLLSRCRGIFRRHDDGCCNGHAPAYVSPRPNGYPPPPPPPPGGEKIGPPKGEKLPVDKKAQLSTPPPPAALNLEPPGLNLNR